MQTSTWLIAGLGAVAVVGCGFGAPSSSSVAPDGVATIDPGLGVWRPATVLPADATAFRAAAAGSSLVIGDQTAWVETATGAWMPAEPVDTRERNGIVEWHGRLISWAEAGRVQTSLDGLTWSDARAGPGDLNAVVVVPFVNRLLLLGEGTRDPIDAWGSVDGSTWSAIDDAPAGMAAAAAVPGHRLLAVGASDGNATLWSTSDTVTWQRMPGPPPGATVSGFRGIAQSARGIVAIGVVDEAEAAWSTSDLSTWTRSTIETGHDEFLASVTVVRGTYVILGQRSQKPAVWLSADGRSWTAVDLPIPDAMKGVAGMARAVDDRIVVFGHVLEDAANGSSFRSSDLVWTLDPRN